MKRIVSILACLLMAAGIGCAKKKAPEILKPYKIGGIFSVTGPASFLGEPEKLSMLMLAEEINKAGGIKGHKIEPVIYDTQGDDTKARLSAEKLITKDEVLAIIGPSRTGTTMAVIPLVEKEKVPLISCAAGVGITTPVKKWVFKTPQTDVMAVERLYTHLKKEGIDKIALITVSNAFGESGKGALESLAPKYGIKVLAAESFGPKDTDMTAQLTKIRGTEAQAIICWGTNPGPAAVAKNVKQLGIEIPLFQSHGVASKRFIDLAGDAANGIILPAGAILVAGDLAESNPQKKVLLDYKSRYEKLYKKPVSGFGGYAYDGLKMVARALEKAGADRAKLRDELENIKNYVGVSGVFNMGPDEHNGLTMDAFVLVKIVDGEWKLMD